MESLLESVHQNFDHTVMGCPFHASSLSSECGSSASRSTSTTTSLAESTWGGDLSSSRADCGYSTTLNTQVSSPSSDGCDPSVEFKSDKSYDILDALSNTAEGSEYNSASDEEPTTDDYDTESSQPWDQCDLITPVFLDMLESDMVKGMNILQTPGAHDNGVGEVAKIIYKGALEHMKICCACRLRDQQESNSSESTGYDEQSSVSMPESSTNTDSISTPILRHSKSCPGGPNYESHSQSEKSLGEDDDCSEQDSSSTTVYMRGGSEDRFVEIERRKCRICERRYDGYSPRDIGTASDTCEECNLIYSPPPTSRNLVHRFPTESASLFRQDSLANPLPPRERSFDRRTDSLHYSTAYNPRREEHYIIPGTRNDFSYGRDSRLGRNYITHQRGTDSKTYYTTVKGDRITVELGSDESRSQSPSSIDEARITTAVPPPDWIIPAPVNVLPQTRSPRATRVGRDGFAEQLTRVDLNSPYPNTPPMQRHHSSQELDFVGGMRQRQNRNFCYTTHNPDSYRRSLLESRRSEMRRETSSSYGTVPVPIFDANNKLSFYDISDLHPPRTYDLDYCQQQQVPKTYTSSGVFENSHPSQRGRSGYPPLIKRDETDMDYDTYSRQGMNIHHTFGRLHDGQLPTRRNETIQSGNYYAEGNHPQGNDNPRPAQYEPDDRHP